MSATPTKAGIQSPGAVVKSCAATANAAFAEEEGDVTDVDGQAEQHAETPTSRRA